MFVIFLTLDPTICPSWRPVSIDAVNAVAVAAAAVKGVRTGIASCALREREISIRLQPGGQSDGIVRAEEAFFPEGVEVETATVVLALGRALGTALLDVSHGRDVRVRKRKVRARLVHILTIARN